MENIRAKPRPESGAGPQTEGTSAQRGAVCTQVDVTLHEKGKEAFLALISKQLHILFSLSKIPGPLPRWHLPVEF